MEERKEVDNERLTRLKAELRRKAETDPEFARRLEAIERVMEENCETPSDLRIRRILPRIRSHHPLLANRPNTRPIYLV